jgi:type IV pilus assembly protein PilQ
MRTIGQGLAVFGCFAAVGVGLAVLVGISATAVENPSGGQTVAAAVANDEPLNQANTVPNSGLVSGVKNLAPPPTEQQAICPHPRPLSRERERGVSDGSPSALPVPVAPAYGQQAPTAGGVDLPKVLDLLRKGLSGPSEPPPAAPSQKPPPVVNGTPAGGLNIRIHDEDIRKVLDLLSEQGNLNILASRSVEGKVSATLNDVDIQGALGAILKSAGLVARRDGRFIFVGTPDDFNNMEQAMDRIGTRTYRPNYITANELKTLVAPLLTERIGVVSVSSQSEAGIGTNDSNAGGDKFSGNEVLVVRDYEAVLCQIDQMVLEDDVRPPQVAIEAMILSVKLKDSDKFGVNFQLLRDNPHIRFGLGSPPAALTDFKLDGGLKFGFLDSNLGAFLNALESIGDTNVVANPRLMVLNKQRAEIQIGQKQGYVSQTITETTSTQSVEFLDTGTQLRLRPFISSDGLIRMEVHPELSDGTVEVKEGFTLPNKNITQTTTNIMVRDGCTVVIGGLIHEQLSNSTTQVPVLGNLPFIGFAFRQTEETTERREVLVLITPRIVYEPGTCQEGANLACQYLRRQSTYADKMSIFGKRSIARRYYRLAENAYAAGEMRKALRFAEMAVQFDPLNSAALELRSDIWTNKPYKKQPVAAEPMPGDVADLGAEPGQTNPLDGETLPDWLIDDLESAPPGPPPPMHPMDPGVPGHNRDIVKPKKLQ